MHKDESSVRDEWPAMNPGFGGASGSAGSFRLYWGILCLP